MHPILDFYIFQLSAYSFFTVLALVFVMTGTYLFARKRGFSAGDSLWMILGMGLSVFIGARGLNIFVNYDWYSEDFRRIFSFSATGFSLYGGIFMAILTGWFVSYFRKIPLFRFADTATPFVGLGIVLMRIGCFLNGCCFGKETNLPWGVKFPVFSQAHIHQMSADFIGGISVMPVHPTQIYELLAALFGTLIALVIIRKKWVDGTAFLIAGIWFSAFRWINLSLRVTDYSDFMIEWFYPFFYAGIIAVCTLLLLRKWN